MKQDKFLIGILAGIGILVLVAVGMFFVRQSTQDYVAEDTPDGVVHNYVYALQQEDYERAYGYLIDKPHKPTLAEFQSNFSQWNDPSGTGVQILGYETVQNADGSQGAVVDVALTQAGRGPFGDVYQSNYSALLAFQAGQWKLSEMPYAFWNWQWYQAE